MMRPSAGRGRRDERGVTVVIFALVLSALLTMSALAVDIGQAYAERRHDQNTVDAAVMSGLVSGLVDGGSVEGIVREVREKVDTTLGREVTDEEWLACTDDEQLHFNTQELALVNTVISPPTNCISFSKNFEELRVKLPQQEVDGVFGPALGFGNIRVDAAANGNITNGTGGLPFVALSTATHGDFVCLRTDSARQPFPLAKGNGVGNQATFPAMDDPTATADPCYKQSDTLADSQRFGTLKPYRYLNNCTQQNTDVEIAIAIGIDHPMGSFPLGYLETPPPPPASGPDPYEVRYDGAPFTGSGAGCQSAYPNTFELDEGLNAGGLSCSLLRNAGDLCNGVEPRLSPSTAADNAPVKLLEISKFDNNPPWKYLRNSADLAAEGSPQSCVDLAENRALTVAEPSTPYWDHYDKFEALVDCLSKWGQETFDGSGVYYPMNELFVDDIGTSARFGFVPQVAEENLDVTYVHIEGFLPVYLYRVYMQQTGPIKKMCDPDDPRVPGSGGAEGGGNYGLQVHDAGQQFTWCGASNSTIDRLASIIFACGMVSDKLCSKPTELNSSSGKDIYDFRLSK